MGIDDFNFFEGFFCQPDAWEAVRNPLRPNDPRYNLSEETKATWEQEDRRLLDWQYECRLFASTRVSLERIATLSDDPCRADIGDEGPVNIKVGFGYREATVGDQLFRLERIIGPDQLDAGLTKHQFMAMLDRQLSVLPVRRNNSDDLLRKLLVKTWRTADSGEKLEEGYEYGDIYLGDHRINFVPILLGCKIYGMKDSYHESFVTSAVDAAQNKLGCEIYGTEERITSHEFFATSTVDTVWRNRQDHCRFRIGTESGSLYELRKLSSDVVGFVAS